MSDMDVHFSAETVEWETPADLFSELDAEFHFQTDVCATPDKAKCSRFFSPQIDGLRQPWAGICWMNPPYGREISQWVKKAYDSACAGDATVVCLLPARTDTRWFHEFCGAAEVRFLKGRLYFGNGQGGATTGMDAAPFPSMIVVFHAHLDPGGICKLADRPAMPLLQEAE